MKKSKSGFQLMYPWLGQNPKGTPELPKPDKLPEPKSTEGKTSTETFVPNKPRE